MLADRSFHTVVAKLIVATELFIALGLWSRRTRYAAVWVAVCFHVAIELSARVEVFSYLAIAALVIWSVPSTGDRVLVVDPTARAQRLLAGAVRSLDWLARFRVEDGAPGSSPRVVDRDGTSRQGAAAVRFVLSRLPVTAWFALPTLLVRDPSRPRVEPQRGDRGAACVSSRSVPPRATGARWRRWAWWSAAVVAFGVLAPPEHCPEVTRRSR